MMRCKAFTANLLTVVRLLIEPSTYIEKLKASLEASISVSQNPITVASSSPVVSTSLSSSFFFSRILKSKSISHQSIRKRRSTVESYVVNISDLCGIKSRTIKMKCTESRNCLSFIDLIKGRCIIFRGPSISQKMFSEAIRYKLLREFSYINLFVIVISLNLITK